MSRKLKVLVIGLSVIAIIIGVLATTVFAQAKAITPLSAPTDANYQAWGCSAITGDYSSLSNLLGMSSAEIATQLQSGKSIMDIAKTKGISEDQVVAAILTPMKEFMQQQVTAGNWTQAQLDTRFTQADQYLRQMINTPGTSNNFAGAGCGGAGAAYNNGTVGGCGYGGMMGGYGTNSGTSYRGMMGGNGGMMGGWGRTY